MASGRGDTAIVETPTSDQRLPKILPCCNTRAVRHVNSTLRPSKLTDVKVEVDGSVLVQLSDKSLHGQNLRLPPSRGGQPVAI